MDYMCIQIFSNIVRGISTSLEDSYRVSFYCASFSGKVQ